MRNSAPRERKEQAKFTHPPRYLALSQAKSENDKVTIPTRRFMTLPVARVRLLIRASDAAPKDVAIYGQEKDIATAGMASMNFVLHNKASLKSG